MAIRQMPFETLYARFQRPNGESCSLTVDVDAERIRMSFTDAPVCMSYDTYDIAAIYASATGPHRRLGHLQAHVCRDQSRQAALARFELEIGIALLN